MSLIINSISEDFLQLLGSNQREKSCNKNNTFLSVSSAFSINDEKSFYSIDKITTGKRTECAKETEYNTSFVLFFVKAAVAKYRKKTRQVDKTILPNLGVFSLAGR